MHPGSAGPPRYYVDQRYVGSQSSPARTGRHFLIPLPQWGRGQGEGVSCPRIIQVMLATMQTQAAPRPRLGRFPVDGREPELFLAGPAQDLAEPFFNGRDRAGLSPAAREDRRSRVREPQRQWG